MRCVPRRVLPLGLASLVVGACVSASADSPREGALEGRQQVAEQSNSVVLRPGDDIQAAIDANPPHTTFLLQSGTYREQSLVPKDGQSFIGKGEVILSGARVLSGWRREGDFWVLSGLPPPLPINPGPVRRIERFGSPEVVARELLFLDGQLYRPVASLKDLGAKTWYRDDDRALITDDPSNSLTEFALTSAAFEGTAEVVVLRDLIIEKYASATHRAAIHGRRGKSWRLENVTARLNHSIGLRAGEAFIVEGGSYSHNGQVGITVPKSHVVVRGAEICRNNILDHTESWEAGGIKVYAKAKRVLVEGNEVCDNRGNGIWTDTGSRQPQIINNRVHGNNRQGIHLELTFGGLVAGNYVYNNARNGRDGKMRGAQILLTQTSDAEVRDNLVVVPADHGNGIVLRHYDRGSWITVNNRVHHNRIVHLAERGRSGAYAKEDEANLRDNLFDHNTYVLPEGTFDQYWWFEGEVRRQAELVQFSLERNGRFIRTRDPASQVLPLTGN